MTKAQTFLQQSLGVARDSRREDVLRTRQLLELLQLPQKATKYLTYQPADALSLPATMSAILAQNGSREPGGMPSMIHLVWAFYLQVGLSPTEMLTMTLANTYTTLCTQQYTA